MKSSSMIMNFHHGHRTIFKDINLSHMLLVFALSFVKLFVALVEILVMYP
jgi:hypothetical protein